MTSSERHHFPNYKRFLESGGILATQQRSTSWQPNMFISIMPYYQDKNSVCLKLLLSEAKWYASITLKAV